jgi:hypothetical protein
MQVKEQQKVVPKSGEVALPRITRMGTDKAAGLCLGKPSGYGFSNPFTSKLARDFETPE